jgi:CubicO group peptidase (beta-lactamase class C family)
MKKLLLLLILSFFSAQSFAGSCPDGSEPVKSVSADGTYFVYKCGSSNNTSTSTNSSSTASTSSSNESSTGINTYGGGWPQEKDILNHETLRYFLYRYLYDYPYFGDRYHEFKISTNPYNFEFDLREDEYIKQHMQTTPLLSYLLYEDGKIVVDEITPKERFGDMFTNSSLFTSMSMGKSIASYITGHAICEGKIESVDSRLNDWPVLEDTLYHNQKLIDLLNMAAGDQAYVNNNGFISTHRQSKNLNRLSVQSIMENELKGSKKSYAQYNYVNAIPNYVLSYLLFKYGDDDFKRLLDDVFAKKIRIRDEIWINKNEEAKSYEQSLFHTVYATRYDYLRIAKAMLDDWQNDTCVGKYLKTIHERRIPKHGAQGTTGRVGMPFSYGGFFHTGYKGMENRPVMSMDGWGGQTLAIDFERGRIIATLSAHDRMRFPEIQSLNWKKIVYERIKNGKPASKSITTKTADSVIDSEQLILDNEARREAERKAKQYWDDYYYKTVGNPASSSGGEKPLICKWASDVYVATCSD